MAGSSNQKMKLIYLQKIFLERTDEEHPLTISQLEDALAEYGISAQRKSLYTDIEALRQFGLDIVTRRSYHNVGYFLGERDFELPELRLLVDAVQSSRFITHRKSTQLIKKLEALASRHQAGQLRRHVYVYDRIKTANERIYINVDALNTAIADGRKASFLYFDYTPQKTRVMRNGGEPYVVSPYALSWTEDNYYLIAHHPKYNDISHFRVDRMQDIRVLEEPGQNIREITGQLSLNVAEYSRQFFGMYAGTPTKLAIRFDNSLINTVIDRFGEEVDLDPEGETFVAHVQVGISPTFYSWLMMFGDKAEILSPEGARRELAQRARAIAEKYNG